MNIVDKKNFISVLTLASWGILQVILPELQLHSNSIDCTGRHLWTNVAYVGRVPGKLFVSSFFRFGAKDKDDNTRSNDSDSRQLIVDKI